MKALISPNEIFDYSYISSWEKVNDTWKPIRSEILNCQRVAQVEPDDKVFGVALPLYWHDCPNECQADSWYFKDDQVYIKPSDEPNPKSPQVILAEGGQPGVIA